ncbi:peptidyl-prolyl cis-trans isomerase SurA [Lutibacter oceani]|uniref:Peptidyl-prolyl cis-trans isomerase SurA n=1 Tax=Lutibacter oceani TaxID=1853311 RepID=A0A3D9RPQ1_9FLAO|nr:peptidylprolyl isomerase [Lutibacter oceani]REE81899.1 peptidyl-prolyl cis-trans isomerase SurA [Lutibacter oceani]
MKLNNVLIIFCFVSIYSFSQTKQSTLFRINDASYDTQEFIYNYEKNRNIIPDSANSLEDYLKLFINYKLKVKEAKDLKLDTFQKYINELKDYKNRLIQPYLKDKEVTDKLVKEAYERLLKEVNASHMLVFIKPNATPNDTLLAYNKLLEAREKVLQGKSFSEVAKQYSEDPSVEQNGGNLGFFTALQMVYPFENAVYSTPVNTISKPFKTKFGYHIVQVHDKRDARGELEVAHIMLKSESNKAKKRIDSIYNLVINENESFEAIATRVSEDNASAVNGGKLNKFSYGQMVEDFSNVAFKLQTVGEISTPFQTKYGWHIIKLLNKYPIESFEKVKDNLTQKIKRDNRSNLIGQSVVDKLFDEYEIRVHENALNQFKTDDWRNDSKIFNSNILTIENKNINQNSFVSFLKKAKYNTVNEAFNSFKEQEVLNYYKENIEFTNKEFAATYNEFKEGLLLFDLLEKKVWEKSKDSLGLSNYFNAVKDKKYKGAILEDIKGVVISDYQNYLEKLWIDSLHKKYQVKINNKVKKKLLKLNKV